MKNKNPNFFFILALIVFTNAILGAGYITMSPSRDGTSKAANLSQKNSGIGTCQIFPDNNFWNVPIDNLPVHTQSSNWINSIGTSTSFHMDFGSNNWDGGPIGIPYNVVSTPAKSFYNFNFYYPDESDTGPYPLPASPKIEWGNDHHLLTIDTDTCKLYELYDVSKVSGNWYGGSGAIWDMNTNALRPAGWTSADAAGLPILPGLARYDEVAAGVMEHALRFTANCTANTYIWPARHKAQHGSCANPVPFGARFRLKDTFNTGGYSPQAQVLLQTFKKYGIVLADNGSNWSVSGEPNSGWNDVVLHELDNLKGSDFEAVDTSTLMIDENSAETNYSTTLHISSIKRTDFNPTNSSSVNFTVIFSKSVMGVDIVGPDFDDFTLTASSSISGASITSISGSGATYTVTINTGTINTGTGTGTLRLDIPNTATITDLAGIPLSNLPYISEAIYTVNKTPTAAALTAPKNNIGTNYNPTYIWDKVLSASYYHLYVSGSNGVMLDQWFEASSICNTSSCSIATSPSATLAGGSYSWFVQTYNPIGTGPWSNNAQPTTFSTTIPTVPTAAVLTTPKNNIGTDYNPNYTWDKVASATYYHLYVSGPSGVVLDQWYPAASICPATTCSVPSPVLAGGNYVWYVQTYNPVGYGPWSNNAQPTNFSTTMPSVPAAAVLTAPKNDIATDYNPNYTWGKVVSATYYHLYVSGPSGVVLDKWYQASNICNTVTCSVASPALGGGAYVWYVQTYNLAGYGPWSNNTQPTIFNTSTLLPAAAVLTTPKNNIGTDYNPTYTWGKVAAATYYRLYVSGPSGVVLDQSYPASICDATTCSVASPTLGGGAYVWYVQTYGPAGYGPWSNNSQPTNFSTTMPSAPATAVLTAPKNAIGTDYNPTYTWGKVVSASYYHLYVAGPGGVILDQWYPASGICNTTTCSVISPILGGGAHLWYVQTYNAAGYGPWSNNAQPTNFSTTTPSAPAGATLTAPSGTTSLHTPTYTWDRVSMATWYHLYIKGPSGVVKDQWYQASSICNATTCSIASPTLESGFHTWWVQTYNSAGYGPWKSAIFTVSP